MFTFAQAIKILEKPLGNSYDLLDDVVLAERRKIDAKYDELFREGNAADLAREWWLRENIDKIGEPLRRLAGQAEETS